MQKTGKQDDVAPPSTPQWDNDLIDAEAMCALFGGSQPIHTSTLYRGIVSGRFPKPIKIGPKTNRWKRDECLAVVSRLSAERDLGT